MHRIVPLPWLFAAALVAPVPALAAQTTAYVTTTDFASGGLSAVSLDSRAVSQNVASVHSDTRLRWHDGLIYVINRLGQDNIQVIDPAQGFMTVQQFSTGPGSNPADIAFLSPTRAYVTRYESADLLIVNPQTGGTLGTIALGAFADADGIPEMDQMIRVGSRVFVSVQRLDRNNGFVPADSSLVVVIDTETDTIVDANPLQPGTQAIRLTGTQPFTAWAFEPSMSRLLVGCVGFFGAEDGGVEWIDPIGLTSLGWAITEAELGGDVTDVAWAGLAHSYAIVSDASFNTKLVSFSAATGTFTDVVFAPGGFVLADAALNDRGELYIAMNDFLSPGLRVFDAGPDTLIAGLLDTGLPPFQIVFDGNSGAVASVGLTDAGLVLAAPWPNPAADAVRFTLRLDRGQAVSLAIHDLGGRRVRTLQEGFMEAGPREWRWDLRGEDGARVQPGVYWLAARSGGETRGRRIVVLK
jgi:hypothetical protein